jgi:Putative prokaryotic signal transducing protein
MVEIADPQRTCSRCGGAIDPIAERCISCGAAIGASPDPTPVENPALLAVDPEHRVEIAHFELDQGDQAELACGMLRANGIACELSNPLLPGLPNERALWVNADDAEQARALLAAAEAGGRTEKEDAA